MPSDLTAAVDKLEMVLADAHERSDCRIVLIATAAASAPSELRSQLTARALALVPQIADDEERSDALCSLVPVLPIGERKATEALVDGIGDAFQRAGVLAALAASATCSEEADEMAKRALQELKYFTEGSIGLVQQAEIIGTRVLPYLSPFTHVELDLIAGFEDKGLAASAIAKIAPKLAPNLVPRAIEIVEGLPVAERPQALLGLAAHPSVAPGLSLLEQALHAALQGANLDDKIVAQVARRLAESSPPPNIQATWRHVVRVLSNRPRPEALDALRLLAPLLIQVDGRAGASRCLHALRDVRQWWR
jgi:hypothetical protein